MRRLAYITHPDCYLHDTGVGHPESIARLRAIDARLRHSGLAERLLPVEAPRVSREQLLRVHDADYLDYLAAHIPERDWMMLDADTTVCPGSLHAAERAAGAVVHAVDRVMSGESERAFCGVRPPGHHAERQQAMGFCLFNNIAVGAAHALAVHGLQRIAIVDFDVHHGNGTEQAFADESRVMLCSSFQHPYYPNRPFRHHDPRIICSPLPEGSGGEAFRHVVESDWIPALERFRPELILISAGFDGHADDTMAGLNLHEADYRWVTERLAEIADRHAEGRIVSTLEGGYELDALALSVEAHLEALLGSDQPTT